MTLSEKAKLNAPATRPASAKGTAAPWASFPFGPLNSGGGKDPTNPFEFWISLFPTAPLFGVKWAFGESSSALFAQSSAFASAFETPFATPMAAFSFGPTEEASSAGKETPAPTAPTLLRLAVQNPASAAPAPRSAASPSLAEREQSLLYTSARTVSPKPAGSAALKSTGVSAAKVSTSKAPASKKPVAEKPKTEPKSKAKTEARTKSATPAGKPAAAKPAKAPAAKASSVGDKESAKLSSAKAAPKAAAKTASKSSQASTRKPAAAKAPRKPAARKPATPRGMKRLPDIPFPIYETPLKTADDLTRIKGVGEKLAAILNDRGVYTFEQISTFDKKAYAWLDETLHAFKGRAERDDWSAQAKALLKSK